MKIRLMDIADYDQVLALWQDTPGMGLNDLDDSLEGISKYLRRNESTCFVAVVSQRIVGAILSGHDGRRGFIYHLAVAIDFQGQGLGKALVLQSLAALKDEGVTKVALVAFDENVSGNAFWEHLGFTVRDDLVYRNRLL